MLFGRTVINWRGCYAARKPEGRYIPNVDTWAAGQVTAIWAVSYKLWKQRNEILHETNEHFETHKVDVVRLEADILEEHRMDLENLHEKDHRLVRGISVEELLGKPISYKKKWLRSIRLAREAFTAAQEELENEEEKEEEKEEE